MLLIKFLSLGTITHLVLRISLKLLNCAAVLYFRFAFVEFENTDDAKEAMDSCNNTDIEGRSIRLEFSQNRGEGGGRGGSG